MPFTQQQIQHAVAAQHAAAHDPAQRIRLIAGPGTGKSFSIEERVCWLLQGGVAPEHIFVVSFTRAAARDLRGRIQRYCAAAGVINGAQVRVTTLHSLALRVLRSAGLLQAYPADPMVMDQWELRNIFDAEFANTSGHPRGRCEEIRREHEAFWSTGQWGPPNYIPPDPTITAGERQEFDGFHGPRTQTYSCVLPGEIVRQCVTRITAGTLDPVAQLHIEHLIVDEFQDLNPIDLEFVDSMIQGGVITFAAGDDDQSIYSFRFASPMGIQTFAVTYGAAQHSLGECFRCTPAVVQAATSLITAFPLPNRIPKALTSLYTNAAPPVQGRVLRWRFQRAALEARAVAESARDLIAAGVPAREILILISNVRNVGRAITDALNAAGVPYDPLRTAGYLDEDHGRLAMACLRICCDSDDYVAHRTVLGVLPGVGVVTCRRITDRVINNNLNFRQLFYQPLPQNIFPTRETNALNSARAIIAQLSGWQPDDTLAARGAALDQLIFGIFGQQGRDAWLDKVFQLPQGITLQELRDYLGAENHEQQAEILAGVYERLGEAPPEAGFLPPRVRIMTMHGAKGLSARVVFVPGLEEEIFPGPYRQPYPGLILEAARLLYVSLSRARAACIVSFAASRVVHGHVAHHTPSRFTNNLGGAFAQRAAGLIAAEVAAIVADCNALQV
jgi:superfamily I DNA/RNA helicase